MGEKMANLRSKFIKSIGVVGTTVAICLVWTGTALAAGGEQDIYGGRGGAMWDWSGRYNLVNLRTVAWDQACNAEGIYAFARVHDFQGYTDIGGVSDDCSGGHSERNGMSWYNSRGRIEGVTSFVCRDKDGSDECVGQYYGNPNP
jgi:hypothetical protein